MPNQRRMT